MGIFPFASADIDSHLPEFRVHHFLEVYPLHETHVLCRKLLHQLCEGTRVIWLFTKFCNASYSCWNNSNYSQDSRGFTQASSTSAIAVCCLLLRRYDTPSISWAKQILSRNRSVPVNKAGGGGCRRNSCAGAFCARYISSERCISYWFSEKLILAQAACITVCVAP